jgi:hypothetical protein
VCLRADEGFRLVAGEVVASLPGDVDDRRNRIARDVVDLMPQGRIRLEIGGETLDFGLARGRPPNGSLAAMRRGAIPRRALSAAASG